MYHSNFWNFVANIVTNSEFRIRYPELLMNYRLSGGQNTILNYRMYHFSK